MWAYALTLAAYATLSSHTHHTQHQRQPCDECRTRLDPVSGLSSSLGWSFTLADLDASYHDLHTAVNERIQ